MDSNEQEEDIKEGAVYTDGVSFAGATVLLA